MNEHAAFLDAIVKDPAAQQPRLIYADWLDEQGDPRGELIRVQCALERINTRDAAWRELDRKEKQLLGRLGGPYLGASLVSGRMQSCTCSRMGLGLRVFKLSRWVDGTLEVRGDKMRRSGFVQFRKEVAPPRVSRMVTCATFRITPGWSEPIPFDLPDDHGNSLPAWTRLRMTRTFFGYGAFRAIELWLGGRIVYAEGF
jgi:uncharacterized protein (TIGR02996 family)